MSLSTLLSLPCTIIYRTENGTTDELGNEIPGETEVETSCEVQQRRRGENPDQGELSITEWDGFFPVGSDLRTADAVRVPGLGVFELVGDPWPVRNPRNGQQSHVEATLRWVRGAEDES